MRQGLILIFLFIKMSCVGTVDTTQKEEVYYTTKDVERFNYEGIIDAKAISHNKIEIDFHAYSQDESIDHYLYVNDSQNPIKLNLAILPQNADGSYKYLLKDLNISQQYKIEVKAENNITGAISENETEKILKTFDNETADFLGITNVSPFPGSGHKKGIVEWNPAVFKGAFAPTSFDPVKYEISYTDLGPEYLDDPSAKTISVGVTKFEHKTSYIIPFVRTDPDEESSDTTFYIRVRAIHNQWDQYYKNDPLNIPVKREQNNVYIEYKTLKANSNLTFAQDSVVVTKNYSGQVLDDEDAGFESLKVTWAQASGIYVGYRIFVRKVESNTETDQIPKTTTGVLPETPGGNTYTNLLVFNATSGQEQTCQPYINDDLGVGFINVNDKYKAQNNTENKIFCIDVNASKSGVVLEGLDINSEYQIKVAVCPDDQCSLGDGGLAILSNFRPPLEEEISDGVIRVTPGTVNTTFPSLASFYGVNNIQNPSEVLDEIKVQFPPVSLSEGYADGFKVYCAPDRETFNDSKVELYGTGTQVEDANYGQGGAVHACDGLRVGYYKNSSLKDIDQVVYSSFADLDEVVVKGISIGEKYCFAATPFINSYSQQVEIDPDKLIIRCITPEILTPTISEFPGIKNARCTVENGEISFEWEKPEGGMYDDYSVFYRKKDSTPFKFSDAIADTSQDTYTRYEDLGNIDDESFSFTIGNEVETAGTDTADIKQKDSNLKIATEYQFGVLARKKGEANNYYYSEGNANIASCYIPKPKATFTEWTRIFAIGPKVDGSIPKIEDNVNANNWPKIRFSDSSDLELDNAHLYETINEDAIPLETNSTFVCDTNAPDIPGDGCKNYFGENGNAFSKTGIISFAWKPVSLDFGEMQNTDDSGYKVMRSDDNGASWIDLTPNQNYVDAIDYSYRVRANEASTTEKMAFFTDFSVKNIPEENGVAKARIYLYKIIPILNGEELLFNDDSLNPHHIIKVTLPPENMALVHRKMANRTFCKELELAIDVNNHYRCDYNGLGARPKDKPWRVGESVIDLGGDLLVDRFELGCNYTRGDRVSAAVSSGASFLTPSSAYVNDNPMTSVTMQFAGKADGGKSFRGCLSPNNFNDVDVVDQYNANGQGDTDASGGGYDTYLYGDCRAANMMNVPAGLNLAGSTWRRDYYLPGLAENSWDITYPTFSAISATDNNVTHTGVLSEPARGRALLTQAEHMAVYYNTYNPTLTKRYPVFPLGPQGAISTAGNYTYQERSGSPTCYINLASIDHESKWYSRWVNISDIEILKNDLDVTSTVSDVHLADGLYGTDDSGRVCADSNTGTNSTDPSTCEFNAPTTDDLNTDRIHEDMPLARIFSSNASNLPPLNMGSPETMQKVCSTYKVDVGVYTNDTFILKESKKKRMLRRNEFVISAKYPESFSEAEISSLEQNTNNPNHSCNSIDKTNSNSSLLSVGANLNQDVLAFFTTTSTNIDTYFATGSFNDQNSTKNCMSKYGIQDLAGNVPEKTSETIHCAYGDDSVGIFYGAFGLNIGGLTGENLQTAEAYRNLFTDNSANPATSVSKSDIPQNFALKAPYPADDPDDGKDTVVKYQAALCLDPDTFPTVVEYLDGSSASNIDDSYNPCGQSGGVDICTKQHPNSTGTFRWCYNFDYQPNAVYLKRTFDIDKAGYCAINDNKPQRLRQNSSALFNDGINIKSIFSSVWQDNYVLDTAGDNDNPNDFAVSFGSSNTLDAQGLDYARNSDGTFLNFGTLGLYLGLPMLVDNYQNSDGSINYGLSFQKTEDRPNFAAKYFSPLWGIPFQCGGNSLGSCGGANADNTYVSLEKFDNNFTENETSLAQLNYPIGNSDGVNQGIDEVVGTGQDSNGNPAEDATDNLAGSTIIERSAGEDQYYYDLFVIGQNANLISSNKRPHQEYSIDPDNDSSVIDHLDLRWRVKRGLPFYFDNGGTGVPSTIPKRVPAGSLSINANTIKSGFTRCGVMINEQ